jgi:hypothetical protein
MIIETHIKVILTGKEMSSIYKKKNPIKHLIKKVSNNVGFPVKIVSTKVDTQIHEFSDNIREILHTIYFERE